ncbi:hypothetical protein B0H65DRAFT_544494 [Neurospora tetraspora]|uniref:Uncharacterized protein n=1 Tax=Neurospora tetraspora TaxID=94610 RepID=A0AAE0JQL3_9PEZI|nr:hypothetical protein B0H65DRAFT_544494 [Neurospora tetraspora]
MFGTTPPSLYQHMPSESGNSSFSMIQHVRPKTPGGQKHPPTPATTPVAERTLSTTPTVVADETLPPTPAETLVNETPSTTPEEPEEPKEPCISFEKDFDPTANMHDQARRLVQDRLAQGFARSKLLIEQLVLREKARVRQILEHDDHDGPLSSVWKYVPDVQSQEFCFYTTIIFVLEHNPILSTTRRGVRSRLPTTDRTGGQQETSHCILQ